MRLAFRKLLLVPFYLLVVAIDVLGAAIGPLFRRTESPKARISFRPGISVVIPERSNRPMLRRCLETLRPACAALGEPVQVIVAVSGADRGEYEDLVEEFPATWIFNKEPLWFVEAIQLGVRAAVYDWVYLLNTDMELDRSALCEAAKWRSPSVFAIASQIYFQDVTRRREETGWTGMKDTGGLVEIFDSPPEDDLRVRAHMYSGGGCSLFQRDLLSRFIEQTWAYAPFYWEDVEWGVLAWRKGFQALFCPESKVWHAHRSTNLKFFSQEEIQGIFKRNGLRFQLRTATFPGSLRTVFGTIARLDPASFRQLRSLRGIADTLRSRVRCYFDPLFGYRLDPLFDVYYGRPRTPGRALVLIVSPYVVYPPSHGGARRLHELIDGISGSFDIILLSDEAENYSSASVQYFGKCHAVCLVGGRKFPPHDGRIERILCHSHRALAEQLRALMVLYDPDLVQIEYVELAKLVEIRNHRPWILTLHDVLLDMPASGSASDDAFELQYINRFDAVVACSPEDGALLRRNNVYIVPNGAHVTRSYRPSLPESPILFLGPFRYPPNLAGIIAFLENVYPAVLARVPEVRLWIFGGVDGPAIAGRTACFQQPGVRVFDYTENVGQHLENCAFTINPDKGIRGSSLKVIESLSAGRVCVSTSDGARGLTGTHLPSLVIVNGEEMAEQVIRLLTDIDYRRGIEVPTEALNRYSWQQLSEEQARIYNTLLQTGSSPPKYAFAQAATRAR